MFWKKEKPRPQLEAALEPFPASPPPPAIEVPEAPRIVFETALDRGACEAACEGIHFYHAFDLSNGLHVPGDWDISRDVSRYRLPDLRGKRVLDIGPASGWFSFYFEKLGADVTVVETRGYGDFDVYGEDRYTGAQGRPADRTIDGRDVWYGPVSGSFWAMHEMLGSKVKFVNGRIYEVGPDLLPEPFDLVFVGALLPHLRDPIGALRAARTVCKPDGLCIATATTWPAQDENPDPVQMLPYTTIDKISWWLPNKAAYSHWFKAAGFRDVDVEDGLEYTPDREVFLDNGVRMNNPMKVRLAHARP